MRCGAEMVGSSFHHRRSAGVRQRCGRPLRTRPRRWSHDSLRGRVGRAWQAVSRRGPGGSPLDVHGALMASTPRNKKVDPLNQLRQRRYDAGHGDAEAFDRQHSKGKLTARERISRLVDRNSFEEIDIFATHRASGFGLEQRRVAGDGVVTGMGKIEGRDVMLFSHDATVFGGSLCEVFAEKVNNTKSGVAHFLAETADECFTQVRRLMSYIPQSSDQQPPRAAPADDPERADPRLATIIPNSSKESYDIKDVIRLVVDGGDFFEVQPYYAMNMVVGFARLDGYSVGIVANQPKVMAGSLDINASDKAARFVRFCDSVNIPLVTFVDVPGVLPGTTQEYGGLLP